LTAGVKGLTGVERFHERQLLDYAPAINLRAPLSVSQVPPSIFQLLNTNMPYDGVHALVRGAPFVWLVALAMVLWVVRTVLGLTLGLLRNAFGAA